MAEWKRLLALLLVLTAALLVAADVDDDEEPRDPNLPPGIRTVRQLETNLGVAYTQAEAIEIPADLTPYFVEETEKRKVLHMQVYAPKSTGKYQMKLPTTTHAVTVLQAALTANVDFKADTSVDGRLTSTFGNFGYAVNQVLDEGMHSLIFFITRDTEIRRWYKANRGYTPSHPDRPVIDLELVLSSEEDDIDAVQTLLEEMVAAQVHEVM